MRRSGLPVADTATRAALWVTPGSRDDILMAREMARSLPRFILTGASGLTGQRMALVLARPEARRLMRLCPLEMLAVLAAAARLATPAGEQHLALVGETRVTCLVPILPGFHHAPWCVDTMAPQKAPS